VLLVRLVTHWGTHRDAEDVEASLEGAVVEAGHASQLNGDAKLPRGRGAVSAVLEVVLRR